MYITASHRDVYITARKRVYHRCLRAVYITATRSGAYITAASGQCISPSPTAMYIIYLGSRNAYFGCLYCANIISFTKKESHLAVASR